MMNQQPTKADLTVDDLAKSVVAHLDAEADALSQSIAALSAMRLALASNDSDALMDAIEAQRQHAIASERLTQDRQSIRREIASAIDIDAEGATISLFAKHVSATTRNALLTRRRNLLRLHREADAINNGNAALSAQALSLIRYFFASDRPAGSSTRYSASGEIQERRTRNTLEAQA